MLSFVEIWGYLLIERGLSVAAEKFDVILAALMLTCATVSSGCLL